MSNQPTDTGIQGTIQIIDQSESIKEIREALAKVRIYLKSMPDDSVPVERVRTVRYGGALIGLGLGANEYIRFL